MVLEYTINQIKILMVNARIICHWISNLYVDFINNALMKIHLIYLMSEIVPTFLN